MLKVFVDAMTSNSKYSCYKMDKLPQSIQIQLSKKTNTFYQFFIAVLQSRSTSQNFVKKDETHSSAMFEIIDSERYSYLNLFKTMF